MRTPYSLRLAAIRIFCLAMVIALGLATAACGGTTKADPTLTPIAQSDLVATEVSRAIQATTEIQKVVDAAIEGTMTAVSAEMPPTPTKALPTSTPRPDPTATTTPTAPALPTEPVQVPTSEASQARTEALMRLRDEGYTLFNQTEIAIMIHPRLTYQDLVPDQNDDDVSYKFTDYNAAYLNFDIAIHKDVDKRRSISDDEIRGYLWRTMLNSSHITGYDVVASDETSIEGHPGRVLRFTFVSDGSPSFGVAMMISYDDWLYVFNIYGDEYEYDTIEAILKSVFDSAMLFKIPKIF